MTVLTRRPLSCAALAICLAGCGGGGSGVVSIPPPTPPAPPPTPPGTPLIAGVTTSQEFATEGASFNSPAASYSDLEVSTPSLSDDSQLDVRYNAATEFYEVQIPDSSEWQPIHEVASHVDGDGGQWILYRPEAVTGLGVYRYEPTEFHYSALLEWFTDTTSGYSAIGIPTPAGNVPTTGTASYTGSLLGSSSETNFDGWEAVYYVARIHGSINLAFDFGSGNLSGTINPLLDGAALPSLSFTNTVYSSGSTGFSGMFGTALPGVNSFSGRFTGPGAEELIGNFAFPYTSLRDGSNQQAAGAFVGRRP